MISNNQNSNIEHTEMENKKIKFIDLFCGLGAFHEAFKKRLTESHQRIQERIFEL